MKGEGALGVKGASGVREGASGVKGVLLATASLPADRTPPNATRHRIPSGGVATLAPRWLTDPPPTTTPHRSPMHTRTPGGPM